MKLMARKGLKHNYFFEYKGRKWSVVDFGSLMDTVPLKFKEHVFAGWEAAPVKEDGQFDFDNLVRAKSWVALKKELTKV